MEQRIIMDMKERIKKHVNTIDPWYLIEMEAPSDEYNLQIDKIASLVINKKPNRANLESELYAIFKTNEFDLEKDKIKKLAELIISMA